MRNKIQPEKWAPGMSHCRLIHCIADVPSSLLASTSLPSVAGHKTNAHSLDNPKFASPTPRSESSQKWHAPNPKMVSGTKKSRVKEESNGYNVPGQWPDSWSPFNIVDSLAPSPLLRLPPELRNTIYEFALRLDKDIRREAISIFYSVNEVFMMIESYSPSVPRLVLKKMGTLRTQYHYDLKAKKVKHLGPRRWRNLVSWL